MVNNYYLYDWLGNLDLDFEIKMLDLQWNMKFYNWCKEMSLNFLFCVAMFMLCILRVVKEVETINIWF